MSQEMATEPMTLGFADEEADQSDTTSTFLDNRSLPIHRWFRYSAGFSALWVGKLIEREKTNGRQRVFDPFAGSDTVFLEGELCDVEASGIEAHSFVARIARAKLLGRENPKAFRDYALSILEHANKQEADVSGYPSLIQRCFPPETLSRLDSLRRAWETTADGSPLSELTWLTLASALRECSPVGTAQWQYMLPNKSKAKAVGPCNLHPDTQQAFQ